MRTAGLRAITLVRRIRRDTTVHALGLGRDAIALWIVVNCHRRRQCTPSA